MTAPVQGRLVRYENAPAPKKEPWYKCCVPKPRRKHSRHLTQHEIDYTISERAKKIMIEEKKG